MEKLHSTSINENSKKPKKTYKPKVCFAFLGLLFAFALAYIIWMNARNKDKSGPNPINALPESPLNSSCPFWEIGPNPTSALPLPESTSNYSCPVWEITGDRYCDDATLLFIGE